MTGAGRTAGAGVLVIGFGNPLRSDDGVGAAVAQRLEGDSRLADARVLAVHQLTPDLAEDIAQASLLVLVDADVEVAAGDVVVRALPAEPAPGEPMTHHLDPAVLVGLARELFGSAPSRVVAVGVGPASVEVGESLTPVVAAAVDRAVEAVVHVIAGEA